MYFYNKSYTSTCSFKYQFAHHTVNNVFICTNNGNLESLHILEQLIALVTIFDCLYWQQSLCKWEQHIVSSVVIIGIKGHCEFLSNHKVDRVRHVEEDWRHVFCKTQHYQTDHASPCTWCVGVARISTCIYFNYSNAWGKPTTISRILKNLPTYGFRGSHH